jgi:hypothetical protein
MIFIHFFNSLLIVGLSLNACATFGSTNIDPSIEAARVSQDSSVLAEGFNPPKDEERPGSTVG